MRGTSLSKVWSAVVVVVVIVIISLTMHKTSINENTGPGVRGSKLVERVREVCHELNLTSHTTTSINLRHILVDDTRRILYCTVPKVSSSSWKRVWLRLTRPGDHLTLASTDRFLIHVKSEEHLLIMPEYEDVWGDMLATYRKFMFVRHPFRRVVAAYRDKVELVTNKEDEKVAAYLANVINSKNNSTVDAGEEGVSFPSFVKLITEQSEEEELLWDSHWRPIHQLCNPCGIAYDFIGQFENMGEDSGWVLDWLGVRGVLEGGALPGPIKTTRAATHASHYLQQLSPSLRLRFLQKYMLDYILFGYDLGFT